MSEAQAKFAATHYAGSQKLTLDISRRLRKYNPTFIVLHYHLGIWQQNPNHNYIIDGRNWSNDYPFVSRHESWFWHNREGERVRASSDGKYLMNISNPEFQVYWKKSLEYQMKRGNYQGVFLDSASIALLHPFARQEDSRLARAAAVKTEFDELGGKTWSEAYEEFMNNLTTYLETQGYAALPNIGGGLITTWDTTDYFTTASGAFVEHAFMTRSEADWRTTLKGLLKLVQLDKIIILQPYLRRGFEGVKGRMYYLANYYLFKGKYTYINYLGNEVKWFPELNLELGAPVKAVEQLSDIQTDQGLYIRNYNKGVVVVNPTSRNRTVSFERPIFKVHPIGGGKVAKDGGIDGKLKYERVQRWELPPWSGTIFVHARQ